MNMKAVLCIPWRGGDPVRERAFALVGDHYTKSGLPIFVADSPGEFFSVAQARNTAATAADRSDRWDVAAFLDADCVMDLSTLQRGLEHAFVTGHVTLPWDRYYSMTPGGHDLGFDQAVPIGTPKLEVGWYNHSYYTGALYAPGGTAIIPRPVWNAIGGYDERFVGWMPEDAAMLLSAGSFDRLAGKVYHFWHPWTDPSTIGSDGPWAEYKDLPILQRLIDEGREITDFGGWSR